MTISKLYLAIDQNGANYSARSNFDFEVFFISEYVSKDLCKNKFKYNEANKLIIYIESPTREVEYDKLFKTLDYKSTLSYLNISKLEGRERTEKILGLIEAAGSAYDNFIPGIGKAIQDSIDRFRNGGYRNVWLFKRKRIDRIGQVELMCELDREMFTLTLVAKNNNTEICRRVILKTKPSSLIYHHKFKDIIVDENSIVIIDGFGKPIYQVSISDMSKGSPH